MDKRAQLIATYGEKVRDLPPMARVVEWQYLDGSGSWGWVPDDDELSAMVNHYVDAGCAVWIDGEVVAARDG